MKKIVLKRTPQGWMATFSGDAEIINLFGADTIPTAYTAQASPEYVRREISALNPEYTVTID